MPDRRTIANREATYFHKSVGISRNTRTEMIGALARTKRNAHDNEDFHKLADALGLTCLLQGRT
jgi:hypothetical protein